ncbi:hypothetical protein R1sor_018611 [Riccia sorocarpa]|uniref:Uncharacterized protein n=1 Tax=Riccia sorocarpa TaxID=122646 RepID=A0ABD3IDH6_9MARC
MAGEGYEGVQVEKSSGVGLIRLHRPARSNALNDTIFGGIPVAVKKLDSDPDVRVIIVAGSGKNFCGGIDLKSLSTPGSPLDFADGTTGVERELFRRRIRWMQDAFTAFELCSKPVIAAIHGACIGGGVDLITACDLRYCTNDAKFSVREVDVSVTADLGSLQRLPGIVGWSTTMELALTARTFGAAEAHTLKLVHGVFSSKDELDRGVFDIAADIAAKSPLAITGTKAVLLRSRNCSVADGLDYVATWNAALLYKREVMDTLRAREENRLPVFSKLSYLGRVSIEDNRGA